MATSRMTLTPVDWMTGVPIGPSTIREIHRPDGQTREPEQLDTEPLPAGRSSATILAWVGSDRDRAIAALAAETVGRRPRVRLTSALQLVIAPSSSESRYDARDDRGNGLDHELVGSQSEAP